MSIARIKVWNPGDILTAADLNGEFNNVLNNGVALWSPANQNVNFNGKTITLDAGAVTSFLSTAASGCLLAVGSKTGSPGVATGSGFDLGSYIFTDNLTAPSGTATSWAGVVLNQPTLAASSTGVTTIDAATLYVKPPAAGTNETITNAWSAWFTGAVRVDKNFGGAYAPWTTGDVKLTIKLIADTGWVFMNDGTLGDASSGATTRANADTSALFTLLWTNFADAQCPVSTGRGGSAAADYAAHKTIALPKSLGRALAVYGAGAGLTARVLGQLAGSETITTVPPHTHSVTDPGHVHQQVGSQDGVSNTPATLATISSGAGTTVNPVVNTANTVNSGSVIAQNTISAVTGITVQNTGSTITDGNLQPTTFLNVMIKL